MSPRTLNLPDVCEHGLTLQPVPERPGHVLMSGNGDTLGVRLIEGFLDQLHNEMLAQGLQQVSVELAALQFVNSSCLKAMVSWIYNVDTTGRPYKIRFLRDAKLRWQRTSLAALQRLAPEIVLIEDVGA